MASDPDQSNELSMLDGDDGSISHSPNRRMTVQIDYFDRLVP